MLIQLWVSGAREYEADATGAGITHNPYALARALQKIDAYSKRVPLIASPSTAHLFIIQPLTSASIGNLFSTHPPIAKRIDGSQDGLRSINKSCFWDYARLVCVSCGILDT